MKKRESKAEILKLRAEEMARGGASNREIRVVLGIGASVMRGLRGRLGVVRAERRVRLRREQTELAVGGNEQMLKLLGEIELAQMRREKPRAVNLPDFGKYPGAGYAANDPRVLVMERNREALEAEVRGLLSMVKNYVAGHPGASVAEVIGALEGMVGK